MLSSYLLLPIQPHPCLSPHSPPSIHLNGLNDPVFPSGSMAVSLITALFYLHTFTPPPKRTILPFPNIRRLVATAEPAGAARLGAVPAAFEAGPRLRRAVPARQHVFSAEIRPLRRVLGSDLFLSVMFFQHLCYRNSAHLYQ